jgi:hypothetical protein
MIFIDSSFWFAIAFAGDRHHVRARDLAAAAGVPLVTSDHVLIETWLLINSRFKYHFALSFWATWLRTGVRVEFASQSDLVEADAIAARYSDQTFSIVDRTSFAIMERLGISRAISFDDDFVIYRHGADRTRAFEVLR